MCEDEDSVVFVFVVVFGKFVLSVVFVVFVLVGEYSNFISWSFGELFELLEIMCGSGK